MNKIRPDNAKSPANTIVAPPGTPMNDAVNNVMNIATSPSGHVDINAKTLATLSAAAQLLRESIENPGKASKMEDVAETLEALVENGSNTVNDPGDRILSATLPVAEDAEDAIKLWNSLPANSASYGASEQRKYVAAAELLGVLADVGKHLVKKGLQTAVLAATNKGKKTAMVLRESVLAAGSGLANVAVSLAGALRLRAAVIMDLADKAIDNEYNKFVKERGVLSREHIKNVPVIMHTLEDPRYKAAAEAVRANNAQTQRLHGVLNKISNLPKPVKNSGFLSFANPFAASTPAKPSSGGTRRKLNKRNKSIKRR